MKVRYHATYMYGRCLQTITVKQRRVEGVGLSPTVHDQNILLRHFGASLEIRQDVHTAR